jgi:hypothetical protein
VLKGDRHVVNCVEPHPFLPMTLASGGIDDSVKVWEPTAAARRPLSARDARRARGNRARQEAAWRAGGGFAGGGLPGAGFAGGDPNLAAMLDFAAHQAHALAGLGGVPGGEESGGSDGGGSSSDGDGEGGPGGPGGNCVVS